MDIKEFTCNICEKNFTHQSSLCKHKKKCIGFEFNNISDLKNILQQLNDFNDISQNKNDHDFLKLLSYQFNNNSLDKFFGDFIIKHYKKDDPAKQSIWNSDLSRLNYVVKELLANNNSSWNSDPKG